MGAWIETLIREDCSKRELSHPMWVRGLKLFGSLRYVEIFMSHPMWVRGLKQETLHIGREVAAVAPYVGAWIETAGAKSILSAPWVAPYVGAWIETRL